MTVALNLNQIFDDIRRKLQLWPLIDQSGNPNDTGNPSPAQPTPNNISIFHAVNESLNWINRSVRCGPITWLQAQDVQPAPQGIAREYWIDFAATSVTPGDMNEVTDAIWYVQSTDTVSPLEPYHYYAEVKASVEFKPDLPAARPYRYRISGTQIALVPPNNQKGQLVLLRVSGIPMLNTPSGPSDTQTIQYLPIAFHDVVQYRAVALLSAMDAMSLEAQQRFTYYDGLANDGMQSIQNFRNGFRPDVTDALKDNQRMIPAGEQQRRQNIQSSRGPGT